MERLTLTPDTLAPLRRGHPWVYTSGLVEPGALPPPGTPVQLVDARGKPAAFGLADTGPIAVRVLDRHPEQLETLVQRRIVDAHALRPGVLPRDTNAYRVVHGEGDGLSGLVIDRYDHTAVIRLYAACWEPYLEQITETVTAMPESAH